MILNFKKKVIDSPLVIFEKGNKKTTTSNIYSGAAVQGYSVGYRARKNSSQKGFVTAGHCYCNNTYVNNFGTVQNRQFAGSIDALWINSTGETNIPVNTLKNWSGISGSQPLPSPSSVTTTVTAPVVGQYIGRVGQSSGHRLGYITHVNVSFSADDGDSCTLMCPWMTNQIETTVYQIPGDSGGIVYLSSNRSTLGIGTFADIYTHEMTFSSAQNINSAFSISRY